MEFDSAQPIFRQLALRIEQDIVAGTYPEETQIPSTNEFAAFLRINPATAKKAVSLLMDAEILVKHRGVGMFVAQGARERLLADKRETFTQQYIHPLLTEAARLEISPPQLADMIRTTAAEIDARGPDGRGTRSGEGNARADPGTANADPGAANPGSANAANPDAAHATADTADTADTDGTGTAGTDGATGETALADSALSTRPLS